MDRAKRQYVKTIVTEHPELREKLYARGFLFTDSQINEEKYPFYNQWKKIIINEYILLLAKGQKGFVEQKDDTTFILIGHAYNPISMCSKENEILIKLLSCKFLGDKFFDEFNKITGIFTFIAIKGGRVYILGDPTCMQTTFYTQIKGKLYISSHTNMLGELLNLKRDSYVKRLSEYRFFPLLGNALPGDLTQFREVKRLVPNHYVILNLEKLVIKRFYWPNKSKVTEKIIVENVSEILKNNLCLIAEKWNKPAISMTGGCDSKTTLACVEGKYDCFSYFSYISSESEAVDAKAARKICEKLGLEHKTYLIQENDSDYKSIEEIRTILEWNTGDIIPINKNDVRKRAFFANIDEFDVEVKSWASEIGRAYYSKRFNGRKKFGNKPTPRKCTTMYKFFLHNRKLVRDTDKVFKEYIEKYFEQAKENPIEWQEQLFWEYRVSSWNGLVITGEHRYSFDITIPYNNRILLELLLSAPIEARINDSIYKRIRERMNSSIDAIGISVTNLKHTKRREKVENIYYMIHSKIPF